MKKEKDAIIECSGNEISKAVCRCLKWAGIGPQPTRSCRTSATGMFRRGLSNGFIDGQWKLLLRERRCPVRSDPKVDPAQPHVADFSTLPEKPCVDGEIRRF